MKKLPTKKILIYSALAQLVLSALFYLYSFKVIHDKAESEYSVSEIQDSLRKIDMDYYISKEIYEFKINKLEGELKITDSLLQKEKITAVKAKNKITDLLNQQWDTFSLETKSVECDSLREQVSVYVEEQDKKDSLYETTIDGLVAISEEKNLQIKMCDSSYTRIRNELNKSILDSQVCQEKLRKQKKQNRIFKIGAAVIAAFTIGYIAK
ncbi:hypothetical protein L0152_29275 [bacterium]|nr:hypothetical protein [bacterium]